MIPPRIKKVEALDDSKLKISYVNGEDMNPNELYENREQIVF